MRIPLSLLFLAALAAQPCLAADPAPAGGAALEVKVAGIAAPQGKVLLSLYDSEADWGSGKPVRSAAVAATGAEVAAAFPGLAPGQYAIRAFHDANGDGRMSTNPFGIPTEPFAFSNDARGERGPASWSAAMFSVGAGANAHRLTFR